MANRRFIDFPIASSVGENDIILIWQSGANKQTTKGTLLTGIATELENLTDVQITSLANGQILEYDSVIGKWKNVAKSDTDLSDLGDVSIVSPVTGQVLVYNATTGNWENSSAGLVPYVGAVTTVNLGNQQLIAGKTTITSNGGDDTLIVNHTSGSGIALDIAKGGNGEGLRVAKSSGSGNAVTITGGNLEAPTIVKTGGTSSEFLKADGSVDSNAYALNSALSSYQLLADKGQPNGYASLDANSKVPLVQINDALIGNVNFQGLWNASTNTPTLVNPPTSDTKGYYYIVDTGGTFASITFEVGDWIISNGTAWGKVDNTDAVSSVFGRTGNVVASNGDYNTSQVTENTNLYYTDLRARGSLSFVAGSGGYNSTTGVITIPTNNNQITNGAGYITSSALSAYLPLTGGTLTGALNGTSASFTGDATVSSSNSVGIFTIGNRSGNNAGIFKFASSTTATNWIISNNAFTANALEFTPSTAGGGDTFTTPSLRITSDGTINLGNTSTAAIAVMTFGGGFANQTTLDANTRFQGPNNSVTAAKCYAWNTYSDQRIKEDVNPLNYGLNEIMQLNPVSYNQHDSEVIDGEIILKETYKSTIGLIAQEVYDSIPESVGVGNDTELWGLDYDKIVPVLIKAIQELKTEIDSLKNQMQ